MVQQVHHALARRHQVCGRRIYRFEPAERLVGRCDVVAVGAKDHQRCANAAEIRAAVAIDHDLAALQVITYEKIACDRQHFLAGKLVEAIPPTLELQEAIALSLRLREERVVFLEHALGPQRLEVLDQPGTVESPGAEVRRPVRRPDAAREPTEQPHGVDASLACPVRQRRAIEHCQGGTVLAVRQRQRDRPTALAVAVDDRGLASVALGHHVDECGQGLDDCAHGLALDGLRIEHYEVHGMAFEQCHANFRIAFEAANARAVAGAWIDHQHRRGAFAHMLLQGVGATASDTQEPVVARRLQVVAVSHLL